MDAVERNGYEIMPHKASSHCKTSSDYFLVTELSKTISGRHSRCDEIKLKKGLPSETKKKKKKKNISRIKNGSLGFSVFISSKGVSTLLTPLEYTRAESHFQRYHNGLDDLKANR